MRISVRFIRRFSVVALCLGAAPFIACTTSSAETGEATQAESEARSSERSHSRGHFIDEILAGLDLKPEQKTEVDKLRGEAKERHAPVKAAKGELMKGLADQIEKGDVDSCSLRPQIDKIASEAAKAYPADRAAFERFHDILTPEQRTKFVDTLRQRHEGMEKAHDKGVLTDAIAKKLDLSDDQKERIEKIVGGLKQIREAEPEHAERQESMTKILDAFKTDHFKLDEVAPVKDMGAHVAKKIKHLIAAGEAVLPVLNDEQRRDLATFVRAKAERKEGERGGTHAREARDEMEEED